MVPQPFLLTVLAAFALCLPATVHADFDSIHSEEGVGTDYDHDLARDLVEHGEIRPLREIISHLSGQYSGEVVGISLKRKRGRWIYEFRILTAEGRRLELAIDAQSMDMIRMEGGE